MSPYSLRARWVLPVDQPPIENGVVTIADGLILSVEPWGKRLTTAGDLGTVDDLGDVALVPGFVNAHTHLEFSDHAIPLCPADQGLPAWIRSVIADRQRANRKVSSAIAEGLEESLNHGVTTIADIATSPRSHYQQAELRPNLLLLQEAIGFSPARTDSVFNDVVARIENCTPGENRASDACIACGISPHAPYTVNLNLLERLASLAAREKMPIAMHLAESPEELQLLREGTGPFRELLEQRSMWDTGAIPAGTNPQTYLKCLSAAEHSLVIHGNYLGSAEIEYLAQHRDNMSVVFCPRTHQYFGHPAYSLEEMLAAGVRVILGTDSRASNPDLSILAELRFLAERYPNIAGKQLLAMGTLDAARALGWQDSVGSLTPGKSADLAALPCSTSAESIAELLHSQSRPTQVWVCGQRVVS